MIATRIIEVETKSADIYGQDAVGDRLVFLLTGFQDGRDEANHGGATDKCF